MPNTIVITDTSCLIALTNIKTLHLLPELYKRVVITKEVCAEFIEPLPQWIEVREVANKRYQQLLENTLDKGEASAIALALELENVLLVVDELKGRKEAERLGIKITGSSKYIETGFPSYKAGFQSWCENRIKMASS